MAVLCLCSGVAWTPVAKTKTTKQHRLGRVGKSGVIKAGVVAWGAMQGENYKLRVCSCEPLWRHAGCGVRASTCIVRASAPLTVAPPQMRYAVGCGQWVSAVDACVKAWGVCQFWSSRPKVAATLGVSAWTHPDGMLVWRGKGGG